MENPTLDNISKNEPKWLIPDYPPLTGETGQAAVNGQLILYPKVVRSMIDPPVLNQVNGLVSFMLFSEPKKLSSGKLVYGFVKLRGNYGDENLAKKEASKIIREHDSKYKIRVAPVGNWLPITEEEAFVKEQLDVRTREDEIQMRDEAVKEKENERKTIMRELREREEEAKKSDVYDNETSIDYYTMKRVTDMKLIEQIEIQKKQIESLQEKLIATKRLLRNLETKFPEYRETWIDRYNEERKKAGIPDFVPSEKMLEEYNNWKDV